MKLFKGKFSSKQKESHVNAERLRSLGRRYCALAYKYQNESAKDGYLLCYLALPILLVMFIESFSRHSLIGGMQFLILHPYAFLTNMLIVAASLTLALIFRRRLSMILIISLIWLICGTANGFLLLFRVTPLTSSDLRLVKDGMNVVSKYLNVFSLIGIFLLVILTAAFCVFLFIRTPAAASKPRYLVSIPMIIGAFLLTWGIISLGQRIGTLETEFRELSQSYRKNGFIYCFGASLIDVGISKPNDYSTESIEQIAEIQDGSSETEVVYYTHKPNVVIVQLESFFDINRLKDVEFSENPLPNFTKMMEDYPSGACHVPVIGAGTVNSEFEVLTGMNIDDFGIGEYPYKTIVKDKPCESLAYNLKHYGYTASAIHNNTGNFYDRNLVYPNLGFDIFDPVEYMWPTSYTPMDWAKDSVLAGEIEKALDSTPGQDFVFTVSVQGHGSYPSDAETDYTHHVTVSSSVIEDEAYLNQVSYYANQLYEMDQFIGELLQMLQSRGEATILVMYGDHCPSLELEDEDLSSGSVYDTEYFIWNNAALPFADQDLEAWEIGSTLLEGLGITDGAVNAYHQTSRAQMSRNEISREEYLAGLKQLEYDVLYGDEIAYNGEYPYTPTILNMGFAPVSICSVSLTKDQVLVVKGYNFTRYSTIRIDGTNAETLYLDPETLVVAHADLGESAQITVSQASLSETAPYAYKMPVRE